MTGVCGDTRRPDGMPTVDQLRAVGADGVRVQAEPGNADHAWHYVNTLARAGFRTAVVLDADAFPDDDYAGWASWHTLNYRAEFYVIGNEPDAYLLPESEEGASWALRPQEYAALWAACAPAIKAARPAAKCVVGGLVSGQPSYLEELLPLLDPPPDFVDIHCYAKDSENARDLLRAYKKVFQDYGI